MFTNAMRDALISGLLNIFKDNIEAIILYGSVARKDNTAESDIDVAIILKKEIDDKTRETFIQWSADMDLQYDRVFSIIDIQKRNMKKWGKVLPFYQNVQNEGLFFGRQLKGTCWISYGTSERNAGCRKR